MLAQTPNVDMLPQALAEPTLQTVDMKIVSRRKSRNIRSTPIVVSRFSSSFSSRISGPPPELANDGLQQHNLHIHCYGINKYQAWRCDVLEPVEWS